MQAIREYLVGIVAAALITGMAMKMLPGGSVGAALKLICGTVMTVAVLQPLLRLELTELENFTDKIANQAEAVSAEGQQQAQDALRIGIIRQAQSYIQDKACELGAELMVEVELTNDQLPVPCAVTLRGQISPYAKSVLSDYLEDALGIKSEAQLWIS